MKLYVTDNCPVKENAHTRIKKFSELFKPEPHKVMKTEEATAVRYWKFVQGSHY